MGESEVPVGSSSPRTVAGPRVGTGWPPRRTNGPATPLSVEQPDRPAAMLLSVDVEIPADLWEKPHRSYFVWEYGKSPDVVIEVV